MAEPEGALKYRYNRRSKKAEGWDTKEGKWVEVDAVDQPIEALVAPNGLSADVTFSGGIVIRLSTDAVPDNQIRQPVQVGGPTTSEKLPNPQDARFDDFPTALEAKRRYGWDDWQPQRMSNGQWRLVKVEKPGAGTYDNPQAALQAAQQQTEVEGKPFTIRKNSDGTWSVVGAAPAGGPTTGQLLLPGHHYEADPQNPGQYVQVPDGYRAVVQDGKVVAVEDPNQPLPAFRQPKQLTIDQQIAEAVARGDLERANALRRWKAQLTPEQQAALTRQEEQEAEAERRRQYEWEYSQASTEAERQEVQQRWAAELQFRQQQEAGRQAEAQRQLQLDALRMAVDIQRAPGDWSALMNLYNQTGGQAKPYTGAQIVSKDWLWELLASVFGGPGQPRGQQLGQAQQPFQMPKWWTAEQAAQPTVPGAKPIEAPWQLPAIYAQPAKTTPTGPAATPMPTGPTTTPTGPIRVPPIPLFRYQDPETGQVVEVAVGDEPPGWEYLGPATTAQPTGQPQAYPQGGQPQAFPWGGGPLSPGAGMTWGEWKKQYPGQPMIANAAAVAAPSAGTTALTAATTAPGAGGTAFPTLTFGQRTAWLQRFGYEPEQYWKQAGPEAFWRRMRDLTVTEPTTPFPGPPVAPPERLTTAFKGGQVRPMADLPAQGFPAWQSPSNWANLGPSGRGMFQAEVERQGGYWPDYLERMYKTWGGLGSPGQGQGRITFAGGRL